ncbi:MAG: motility protein A [Bdellovibrionota bacterium]
MNESTYGAEPTKMEQVFINPLRAPEKSGAVFDYATFTGIAAAFGLVLLAILLGGQPTSFLDLNSFLIVFGGTIGATFINYPMHDVTRTLMIVRNTLWPEESSGPRRMREIVELAGRARSEGVLSLEGYAYTNDDPFFRRCVQLLVDGLQYEDVRRTLELELLHIEDRHRRGAQIFQSMGTIAPGMGLIGTLIGLVQMLQHLEDPSKIGPGMATALLTTFYGAFLCYVVFNPLAGKLRSRSHEETNIKEMTIEGILCILRDMNPRLIEQRLLCFLPPEQRQSKFE